MVLMVGWYIGILGIISGVVGGIYFLVAYLSMDKRAKMASLFFVLASFVYIIYSAILIGLGFSENLVKTDFIWQLVPILFFVSTILFIIAVFRLVSFLKSTESSEKDI